jgi:hypothetical protein
LKIKSERDFWSGLMFIAIGVIFAIGRQLPHGSACPPTDPCAQSLWAPFQLLCPSGPPATSRSDWRSAAILGAIVSLQVADHRSEGGDPVGAFAWRPRSSVVVAIAVFGAMLEPLGMLLTVPVLIFISSLAGDEFHWKGVTIAAIVLTIGSWAIFVWGLKLTIPVLPWFAR